MALVLPCHIIATLLCFVTLSLLISPSRAQNSPQDYVNAHNIPRRQVGVGPISWDGKLVRYAQNYANQRIRDCALTHSNGPYGENLAKASYNITGVGAVKLWVDEKQYYNHKTNSCTGGQQCGHYTQVVWRDSVRVGCARVKCSSGWYFVICSYDPPGNFVGESPY